MSISHREGANLNKSTSGFLVAAAVVAGLIWWSKSRANVMTAAQSVLLKATDASQPDTVTDLSQIGNVSEGQTFSVGGTLYVLSHDASGQLIGVPIV